MRLNLALLGLLALALALTAYVQPAEAADPTFVGKLAVAVDAEVARELGLSDEVQQKLKEIVDQREKEVVDLVGKLKGQTPAKQAEALAPFVAETEKIGMALLTDAQQAKLNKLAISRLGMVGVLQPDVAKELQFTDDQKAEIGKLIDQYRSVMTRGNDIQKRVARESYEKRIASALTDAQRTKWEQLAGASVTSAAAASTAGSTAVAPVAGGSKSELVVSEDGTFGFNFQFAPWKDVIDFFARQGGYAFTTEKYPSGTFSYSDPKKYTAEEALDVLNLHLMLKGFMLVKREKLLKLFDVENDGPVPQEFIPTIKEDDIEKRGEFELIKVQFQLSSYTPEAAKADISSILGPYGSIVTLSAPRQIIVAELGGKMRMVKRIIDAVENPDAYKDEKVVKVKLQKLTPTEFLTMCRQLFGIPDNMWQTMDGSLRLTMNDLEGVIVGYGKSAMLARVEELAKLVDVPNPSSNSPAGPTATDVAYFDLYPISQADPALAEMIVRTLLVGAPDAKMQLDQKTGVLNVLAHKATHDQVKAILAKLDGNGETTEVLKLRRMDPQTATSSIGQLFGTNAPNAPKVSPDAVSGQITVKGTPAQVAAIKAWLVQKNELQGETALAGGPRPPWRILQLSERTLENILPQAGSIYGGARLRIIDTRQPAELPPAEEDVDDVPPSVPLRPERPAGEPAANPSSAPLPNAAPSRPTETRLSTPAKRGEWTSVFDGPGYSFVSEPTINAGGREVAVPASSTADLPVDSKNVSTQAAAQPSDRAADAPAGDSAAPAAQPAVPQAQAEASQAPEVIVRVTPSGVVIMPGPGTDPAAVDEFEALLQQLANDYERTKKLEIYHLRYTKADVAFVLLEEMLSGGASVSSSNFSPSGIGGMLGLFGGGGSTPSSGGTITTTSSTSVTITPDPRLNALYVQALPADLQKIEDYLNIIDREAGPESVQTQARPRFIPVAHGKAEDVYSVVSQVYASRIATTGNQRGGGNINPEQILRALAGGRGGQGGRGGGGFPGFGGGRGQQVNRGEEAKMTLGVDVQSNSLIVSAPDYLYEEVKAFVEALDVAAYAPDEIVRVVRLGTTSSAVVTQQLKSMLGESATVTEALPISTPTQPTASTNSSRSSNSNSGASQRNRGDTNRTRQAQSAFNNRGNTGRGGNTGGNFGGGNRGSGNFNSGRGNSGGGSRGSSGNRGGTGGSGNRGGGGSRSGR